MAWSKDMLRFGNMLGERGGFVFAQLGRCVFVVHDSLCVAFGLFMRDYGFVGFGLFVQENVLSLCFLGPGWRSWFGVFDHLRLVMLPLGNRLSGQWLEAG